jgi:hypothetical protein
MFGEKRVRIAAGLMLGVLSLLGGAQAVAATAVEIQYACDGSQRLTVRQANEAADVRFIDRTYRLNRKSSNLGERYSSANAALAIDGSFAVFVAGDRLQLGKCVEVSRSRLADRN